MLLEDTSQIITIILKSPEVCKKLSHQHCSEKNHAQERKEATQNIDEKTLLLLKEPTNFSSGS